MKGSFLFAAIAALAAQVMAQGATFSNMTWSSVTVGQTWDLYWTVGTAEAVNLTLGSSTWSWQFLANQPAMPSKYTWAIAVPSGFMPGNYTLGIAQGTAGTSYSPIFTVALRAEPSTTMMTSASTSSMGAPTVTVTWWDPDCACHKTTTTCHTAAATGTGAAATSYTWYDSACGCTKTALTPAPTTAMCPGAGCSNYTAPAPTPMSSFTLSPSGTASASTPMWTGAAPRLSATGWLAGAVVAAVLGSI